MKPVKFTEFRQNASELLSKVEKGEIIYITRHGKVIAEISPPNSLEINAKPSWKNPSLKLENKGSSFAKAIIQERGEFKK